MATRSQGHHEAVVATGSKTDSQFELTDKHWELIEDLFPWKPPGAEGGRPPVKPRECLEGILWVLRTGARWKDLPKHFPSKSSCHLWFQKWTEQGIIEEVLRRLLLKLDEQGKIDCSETFGDGTFSSAKKRGKQIGPTRRGKGTKVMLLVGSGGFPLAIDTESANVNEVRLIERLVDNRSLPKHVPERLIYDKAADSNPLRARLSNQNIDLICPNRKSRKHGPMQDKRKLRRYRRRWIVERTISWIHNFRRTVVRYEFYAHLFKSFVQLAAIVIL
jgi:transposase